MSELRKNKNDSIQLKINNSFDRIESFFYCLSSSNAWLNAKGVFKTYCPLFKALNLIYECLAYF